MTYWHANRILGIQISVAAFCLIGVFLLGFFQPWLAFGIAGLAAGLISLPAIKKEKRTFWRMLAMLSAESVGVGLVAYFVFLFIR